MGDMNAGEGAELNLAHAVRPAQEKPREAEGRSPGLLLLHGRGADEMDLMGLEGALDPQLMIVSARAPFRLGWGYAWYGMAEVGNPDEETLHASVAELREFIPAMVEAYDIDPDRLFLLGFSQGAVMAAAMALLIPEQIRGVIMHSGYVPTDSRLDLRPEAIRGKPFFVAHGIYDQVIPITFGRAARDYLTEAGADLTYREYPIAHSISEESLYDLSEWLARET